MKSWRLIICSICLWLVGTAVVQAQLDEDFFKIEQNATASKAVMARQKAVVNARNALSALINGKLETVTKSYMEHNGTTGSSGETFLQETKTCARMLLQNVSIVKESTVQETNKQYTVYVTLQIKKSDVLKSLCSHMVGNDKIKDSFNTDAFSEIWNKSNK